MIPVNRGAHPPPLELIEFHRREMERLTALYTRPEIERSQQRPEFRWSQRLGHAVRDSLIDVFHGKCAFCERQARTIEHFRPKWRASRLDGRIDTEHYWWLLNEWSNLYLCCHDCNTRKANLFPISGEPAAPLTFGDKLRDEGPLLLDPCHDDPQEHLQFSTDGIVTPLTQRGDVTIKVFQLNAPYLIASRRDRARSAKLVCETFAAELKGITPNPAAFLQQVLQFYPPDSIHLAVVHAVADEFIRSATGVPPAPPPTIVPSVDTAGIPSIVWLDTIEISNFKTIKHLKLTFPTQPEDVKQKGQPWLMVLGENSVGKSSLLQAVALTLMPDEERERLGRADACLTKRTGASNGYVRLTFTDGSQRKLSFAKGDKHFQIDGPKPDMPVLAYGSTRLLPGARTRKPDRPPSVSVRNLFDHTHPLVNAERYLCDTDLIDDERFNLLATSLKDLLPVSGKAHITRNARHMKSTMNGLHASLDELSDGYKSVLALAMDIMFHLSNSSFDMESAQGLVMVDELELHLHPRWKIRIIDQLRTLFPRVRFIVSTHDPLCVHGLQNGELHVMAKHPRDNEFMIEQIDVPQGTRADEVLTGPWFGLPSTMDAETLEFMSEHSALLQRPERTVVQTQRMHELEELLRKRMGTFGNTRAQRAAMAAAAVLDRGMHQDQYDLVIKRRLNEALSDMPGPKTGDENA